MIVCAYFHPLSPTSLESNLRLILLWRQAWLAVGATPVVLNAVHATRLPEWPAFETAINKFPSINPAKYDHHCFARWSSAAWYASQVSEPILMTDYDVIPYAPFTPPATDPGVPVSHEAHVPCCVWGNALAMRVVCARIAGYRLSSEDVENGRPHLSDMHVFLRSHGWYRSLRTVKEYGEPGWETSDLVHYASGVTRGRQKWEFIPGARKMAV